MNTYTIGHIAHMTGISTRTLRYYDEIGLLTPSERSSGGYRLYTNHDAEILVEILIYRELEIPLDQIDALIKNKSKRTERLRAQQRSLIEKRDRLNTIIERLFEMIDSKQRGITMNAQELFDGFNPSEYEDEAKDRWGETDAYKESARRTAHYTDDDWKQYKLETESINNRATELMNSNTSPYSPEAHAIAERHRANITKWFYDCSYDIHANLADMYIGDERFKQNIDKDAPGLAQFWHDVIIANALIHL